MNKRDDYAKQQMVQTNPKITIYFFHLKLQSRSKTKENIDMKDDMRCCLIYYMIYYYA